MIQACDSASYGKRDNQACYGGARQHTQKVKCGKLYPIQKKSQSTNDHAHTTNEATADPRTRERTKWTPSFHMLWCCQQALVIFS